MKIYRLEVTGFEIQVQCRSKVGKTGNIVIFANLFREKFVLLICLPLCFLVVVAIKAEFFVMLVSMDYYSRLCIKMLIDIFAILFKCLLFMIPSYGPHYLQIPLFRLPPKIQ